MPPATKRVELIGHRGAKREFPENSLPAFARALERGADAVELDVHATADGVAVVHHDADVRVPAARGRALRPISEISWHELSRVELSPEVFIPSLEQVLDAVSAQGTVYVELKGRNAEAPAIAVIRSRRTRCAVHSFDHGVIARAARLAPELRRGILFDEYPADVEQAMRAASALDVWPQWELIDAALVDRVHANGGRVIAWTVNTTAAARKLVGLGVDGLCGDDVRLLQL
jgi:glycerophosphoryl diester phosphodiesterase